MKNRNVQKLKAITPGTLIVGVDIAKGRSLAHSWSRYRKGKIIGVKSLSLTVDFF